MVYESLVLSLMLYNSETWTLREDTKQRLRVFEMGSQRRILGVIRRDRISNAHIRERLNLSTDIVQRVAERRLRFFGHVVGCQLTDCPSLPYRAKCRVREAEVDHKSAG